MPTELITIEGLRETEQRLSDMPRLIVQRAFLKALAAAVEVIQNEVRTRTPERDEGERNEDQIHLVDALMSEIELDADGRGGIAKIGFGREGYRALFVEYGHQMVGHKPGKKEIGFVPAHPFMRLAFDASKERAVDEFRRVIAEELNG